MVEASLLAECYPLCVAHEAATVNGNHIVSRGAFGVPTATVAGEVHGLLSVKATADEHDHLGGFVQFDHGGLSTLERDCVVFRIMECNGLGVCSLRAVIVMGRISDEASE